MKITGFGREDFLSPPSPFWKAAYQPLDSFSPYFMVFSDKAASVFDIFKKHSKGIPTEAQLHLIHQVTSITAIQTFYPI